MKGRLIYVVGPSGAGKDSLLHFAREHVAGTSVVFAHRYITRETGHNENHIALTREEFDARSARGLFALEWSSHELHYGIGIEIDAWLERGCTVVVNGSRAYLSRALKRYQHLEVVHVHAAPDILAARLSARGRETREQVEARLARQAPFALPDGAHLTHIDNSGSIEEAGLAFVNVLKGFARTQDRAHAAESASSESVK
ncbi:MULTISPECIES: phosphonate metabolism protein/1,5-bisphosphokinase (PRPP-forming) PhnN [Paraburkholderia]|jgi:ribose 1,5-bisphosphokinase|uniref:Ribose 1,5-bisphosphate phosphokinase PhnN n=1 Tax=Paraburkholderia largidicola TaxID=3014751 RepID=A0A7I8BSE8_9BURK|nr:MULTISPECIES: phosphonate metabolism protein/1,5-bisphosphokinase (PRPP-forming) PhnN [Paraburkholderia]BEU25033.1 phosphonate metabolism protein/1,5-bisphosphokinase (PRPP-forming) PhnN [Paraburkholderia sp. 22B1P]GJH36438.1 phosphonate metabolism protein/1,5-bisphosphokinase (PRPP-forming) PhnN [Paraburkholderia hospita]CAG9245251.1 ribose 1,5-bisphosphate phosphokinase [Paraburkholderia caribensis]BCF91239.1 ribose 1,5-bisphosphate phosphokinase PhnN [Paraburkholderia sp. PGU16]GJH02066.